MSHPVRVGRWATFDAEDDRVPELTRRMILLNPAWRSARAQGFSTKGIPRQLRLFEERDGLVHFPRALADELDRADLLDETTRGLAVEATPSRIELRDEQATFVASLTDALEDRFGAIGQAPPGFGKTVIALEVIARMGLKTIVLVHKEFLMTQWAERLQQFLELPLGGVGLVQQSRCEWREARIVLAMAQSLLARRYEPEFYEAFGLVVVDEVHRFAAPTFQQTITMFPAARRLGVTATPERADGLEDIFLAHIGAITARHEASALSPRVFLQRTPVDLTPDASRKITRSGRDDRVRVNTFLARHPARNRQLVELLARAAGRGRKVLLLADRRQHLMKLARDLEQTGREAGAPLTTAFYVGGMSAAERKSAEGASVILATFAMAKEGLDIPALDTLFLASPRSDVLQAVGRILRPHAEKQEPVVMDFVDEDIGLCRALARKRQREYEKLGWKVARAPET